LEVKFIYTRSLAALVGVTRGNFSPVQPNTETDLLTQFSRFFLQILIKLSVLRRVHKMAGSDYFLHIGPSVPPSVLPQGTIRLFLEGFSRNLMFEYVSKNSRETSRITGIVHEHKYAFLIISHAVLLRTRNVSDKCAEKIKTNILRSITFFSRKSCLL
jgi:hypothetical protein